MLDFVSIKAELDGAGTDLHKIEEIYARVHAEIEAAPADKRAALEAKYYDLCNEQASRAKQALDAHAHAAKAGSSGRNKKAHGLQRSDRNATITAKSTKDHSLNS